MTKRYNNNNNEEGKKVCTLGFIERAVYSGDVAERRIQYVRTTDAEIYFHSKPEIYVSTIVFIVGVVFAHWQTSGHIGAVQVNPRCTTE